MKNIMMISLLLFTFLQANAQTILSAQNGNWYATSTWQGGIIPTASHDVVIRHAVTFDGITPNSNAFAKSILISNTLGVPSEFLVIGGTVSVGIGGIALNGLPSSGTSVQMVMQSTSIVTSPFLSILNQMPGNFSCKLSVRDNAELTVNSLSYSYTPSDMVSENQNEITLTENAKLKVNANVNLYFSSVTKNAQLEFYADDASFVEIGNNLNATVDYTLAQGNDGIRIGLGTHSVGSTADLKVGGQMLLFTYGGEDIDMINTKNAFTLSDLSTAEIGTLQLTYTGEIDVPAINQARVMSSSKLVIKSALSCVNQFAFSEYNNSFYMTGTSTVTLEGTIGGIGVGGAGVIDINSDADITTFIYAGTVAQQIASPTEWYENLTINNTSGVPLTLSSPISLSRTLTMQNGILETGGYDNFIMRMTASANQGNAQSYITGGLVKRGSTHSFFPIGNNNVWAPIHINTNGNGNFNTRFEIDYSSTVHPVTTTDGTFHRISTVEYYTVRLVPNPDNGSFGIPSNATLTFYYKDACSSEITNTNTTPTQDLIIARKGTSLPNWAGIMATTINPGSDPCGVDTEQGSLSITVNNSVEQYGEFTFGFIDAPMPVTWVDFSANVLGDYVELKWQTATEINTDYFEIQKSTDGNKWQTIGQVKAAEFSTILQTYFFNDNNICDRCYYRLLQADINGSFSYSSVIKIFNDDRQHYLSPNPFTSNQNICLKVSKGIQKIEIFDATGKSLVEQHVNDANEICLKNILQNGMYTVRLYNAENLLAKTVRLLVAD